MKSRNLVNLLTSPSRILVFYAALGLTGATAWAEPGDVPKAETSALSEWLSADGITEDWGGFRGKLVGCGVDFFATEQVEVWGNTTGGLERGTVYTGLLKFGLDLDLDKAVGWCGASVHTSWLWLSGPDASGQLVGNFLTISSIAGFNTLRMFETWFQQNLLGDKFSLRFGQLSADTEFVISNYAVTFLNASFGWPAFMYENMPGGGPAYPVGTLGVRLAVKPFDSFKFQTAVFQGNVYAQNVNLHGFDWRLDSQNGIFFINEAQFFWGQNDKDMGRPGEFKAGAWLNTAQFAEANDDNFVRGNYGFYFILDQMLCPKPAKLAGNPSDQGLACFGRIAFEPQDHDFIVFYLDTGLTYKGIIPCRCDDTLGVGFAYARLSSNARDEAISEGSVGVGAEMVLETTYLAQINKWLSIQPDLQLILNPGGNKDLRNAFVIGGRVSVTF